MRKLLNTLFVLTESSYLSLDGENVVVSQDKAEAARFPLHTLEGILCFSYAGASPALMGACAQRDVDLAFFTPRGRFLARSVGETKGNVLLRQQQFRAADDADASCRYAKGFLLGKIYNARWVLERATRDHPQRVPVDKLKALSGQLAAALPRIENAMSAEALRGIEGEAAQLYFSGFDDLILQQRKTFTFTKRTRRPPLDPVNALLSFAYTLLARDCAAALEGVGLDPYVGFLHRPRPGRTSLALDLMEELRTTYADRFVLTCINQKIILPKHCVKQESHAVLLTDEGRRAFLQAWQLRKQQTIQHPFLGEKIPWGLVPYVQALLLARTLRGDLDRYPRFFWKYGGLCMLVLVTYDVNTETAAGRRRLRKVAKACVNYGQRVQNSVFECILDAAQYTLFKAELTALIDPATDSLRFYQLGNRYKAKVEQVGRASQWPQDGILLV